MSVVMEEIVVTFHSKVLFEVFGDANDAIAFSWVQNKGNFLQICSFLEMYDVLDPVDQLRQQQNLSLKGLNVRMIPWYPKRKDEVRLLMVNFLLNEVIEMEIEISIQLFIHYIP